VVHRTKRSYLRPVANGHVSAQRRSIGQDHVISDPAIVRDVRVCHDQRMVAHSRQSPALHCSTVDSDKFPDLVVISDLESRRLTRVGQVLRSHADGAKREESIVRTDRSRPFDNDVRHQVAALAQFHVRPHRAIRADLATGMNLRARIHHGCGVNCHLCGGGQHGAGLFGFCGCFSIAAAGPCTVHHSAGDGRLRCAFVSNVGHSFHASRIATPGRNRHFKA
jgi:hypothetical protein